MGEETFSFHLSKQKKKRSDRTCIKKIVRGESARIYRFSFVFFCRSITATAEKKKKARWLHISAYGSKNNLYRKFMRITAAWLEDHHSSWQMANDSQGGIQDKMAISKQTRTTYIEDLGTWKQRASLVMYRKTTCTGNPSVIENLIRQ